MKSNKLFDLIQSMSKTEKGFFKKNAKLYSHTESQYVKLFEAIDKQAVYDEAKLLKKFRKESFAKHFHVTKNYLFNAILSSLKNYRSKKSKKSQLEQLKMEIEILIERFLYPEADKLIQKAKKQAYAVEYFELLLSILKLEWSMCTVYDGYTKISRKTKVRQEIKEVLAYLENQEVYGLQSDKLMQIHLFDEFKKQETKDAYFQKVSNLPELQDVSLATTFESKRKFWQIHFTLANFQNKPQVMLHASEQLLALWAKHPLQQEEQPYAYISALSNHFIPYAMSSEFTAEGYLVILDKMKAAKPYNRPVQVLQKLHYFYDRLMLMPLTLNFEGFDKVVEEVNSFLKEDDLLINIRKKRELIYLICGFYTVIGDSAKALNWSYTFEQLPKSDLQEMMSFSVELFVIMAHFQERNIELVLSKTRSLQRQLQKQPKSYASQKLVLQMLAKLEKLHFLYNSKELWEQYSTEFKELIKDPKEHYALGNFDILTWIKAQMNNTTMEKWYQQHKNKK